MTPRASAALEIAMNRFIGREASALDECRKLSGRSIAFCAIDHRLAFMIEFQPVGVRVDEDNGTADANVVAPLAALLAAALGAVRTPADERWKAMTVDGDRDLVAAFSALLARVGFDPEELLASAIGGALSHRFVGIGRALARRVWKRPRTAASPDDVSALPGDEHARVGI